MSVSLLGFDSDTRPGLEVYNVGVSLNRVGRVLGRNSQFVPTVVSIWSTSDFGTVGGHNAVATLYDRVRKGVSELLDEHAKANASYKGAPLLDDNRKLVSAEDALGGLDQVRILADVTPAATQIISSQELANNTESVLKESGLNPDFHFGHPEYARRYTPRAVASTFFVVLHLPPRRRPS